jgi:hypothetical protein
MWLIYLKTRLLLYFVLLPLCALFIHNEQITDCYVYITEFINKNKKIVDDN